MSPDLAFILSLGARMAVTAAVVVIASVVTERSGPTLGALVASLPLSAGPSYTFLAIDHGAAFISESALASITMSAATIYFALAYVWMAQRHGVALSLAVAFAVWIALAVLVRQFEWSLTAGIVANIVTFAICLPLVQRFRTARMPLVRRRWYDMPLRAGLVASLVAIVVTASNHVGPAISGIIALFPNVFLSLIIVLHPRLGGPVTAAVIANGLWGLIGFSFAIVTLHVAALPLGSVAALSLALAVAVGWNFGMWWIGRHRRPTVNSS